MYCRLTNFILQVVIKSATPQLSKKVLSFTDGNMSLEKAIISLKPILIIADWYPKVFNLGDITIYVNMIFFYASLPWCCFPYPSHPQNLDSFNYKLLKVM